MLAMTDIKYHEQKTAVSSNREYKVQKGKKSNSLDTLVFFGPFETEFEIEKSDY